MDQKSRNLDTYINEPEPELLNRQGTPRTLENARQDGRSRNRDGNDIRSERAGRARLSVEYRYVPRSRDSAARGRAARDA